MKRTPEDLITEAEFLAICNDPDMWDEWLTGLSEAEFILYQRWANRTATDKALAELAQWHLDLMRQGIEFLESLAVFAKPERIERLGERMEPSHVVSVPSALHYNYCRNRKIIQYAARRF